MNALPDARAIARRYGGTVSESGRQVNIPTEGHGRKDRGTSITIDPAAPDGVLVHVHNGGDPLAVKDMLRRDGFLPEREVSLRDASKPMFTKAPRPAGVTYFEYEDADGATVCRKVRTEPGKTFTWQHPDGNGGWNAGRGCDTLFYRLPDLIAAPDDAVIYFAEGEQKADKLAGWGLVATSSKDLPDDLSLLQGRRVVILPDNDKAGATIASKLAERLEGIAGQVVLLDLPGLPPSGDIVDWGGDAAELERLATAALEGRPEPLPGLCGPEDWDGTAAPAREFVVPHWVARGAAGLLGGEDGVGKSLLAQQMAAAAAAGVPFLGLEIDRCRALYLTCEDDRQELHRRQEAINRTLGLEMSALKGWLQCVSLKGEIGNEMATFTSDGRMTPTARYEQIRATVLAFGAQLVFIDNAAHVFAGNENARHDVAAFLGLLERLSIEIDGAVILLAHPNKQHSQGNKQGNEYSGTTGWSAHVRNRLFLDWESGDAPNPDGRVLRRSKANYARKGEEIEFIWHDWAFTRLDDLEPSFAAQVRHIARAGAENDAFLSCLATCTEQRRAVSHNPGSNYAPKVFAAMTEGKGHSQKAFAGAMERLLHLGTIALDQPLWRGPNRVMKQGIALVDKSGEICTDPPARTPCTDPHETRTNAARFNPPITNVIDGAATRSAAPPVPIRPSRPDGADAPADDWDIDPFDPRNWDADP
jgi:RecA-family ATPase